MLCVFGLQDVTWVHKCEFGQDAKSVFWEGAEMGEVQEVRESDGDLQQLLLEVVFGQSAG